MSELPILGDRHTRLRVFVDWNNDGDFSDANENVSLQVLYGRMVRGRQKIFDQFGAASCEILLDNRSGIYSAANSAGALYGSLLPGRAVKVEAVCAGAAIQQFYGYIGDYDESRRRRDDPPIVRIIATDGFDKLRHGKVQIPLQENRRVDQIISTVLDAISWPFDKRDLHVADATLRFYWVEPGKSPLEVLLELAGEEPGGRLFISKTGALTFRRKDDLAETTKITLKRVTTIDTGLRQEDGYDKIEVHHAAFTVDENVTAVFTLNAPLPLQPGTNTFEGSFTTGAKNVLQPVGGPVDYDYWANPLADDTSTDDATPDVTVTSFTAYGGDFSITFTNARTTPVYLTFWQIVGEAIRASTDERVVRQDIVSPFVSNQLLTKTFKFMDDRDLAASYTSWLAVIYELPQPRPVIELQAAEAAEQNYFLMSELQDKIKLENVEGRYPTMLNDYFHVDSQEVVWQKENLMPVKMTLSRGDLALGEFLVVSGDG